MITMEWSRSPRDGELPGPVRDIRERDAAVAAADAAVAAARAEDEARAAVAADRVLRAR